MSDNDSVSVLEGLLEDFTDVVGVGVHGLDGWLDAGGGEGEGDGWVAIFLEEGLERTPRIGFVPGPGDEDDGRFGGHVGIGH